MLVCGRGRPHHGPPPQAKALRPTTGCSAFVYLLGNGVLAASAEASAAGAAGATPGRTHALSVVAVTGLVALAEGVELVGERQHEVAGQRVVAGVVDVGGGHRARYIFLLLEQPYIMLSVKIPYRRCHIQHGIFNKYI